VCQPDGARHSDSSWISEACPKRSRLSATARAQYRCTQPESTFIHVILRCLAHERFEARSVLRAQRVQLRLESRSEIEGDAQITLHRTAIENHRQALHLEIGEAASTNQPFERPGLCESESAGRIRGRRRRIEHGPSCATQYSDVRILCRFIPHDNRVSATRFQHTSYLRDRPYRVGAELDP